MLHSWDILNPEGFYNCITGTKGTAILPYRGFLLEGSAINGATLSSLTAVSTTNVTAAVFLVLAGGFKNCPLKYIWFLIVQKRQPHVFIVFEL